MTLNGVMAVTLRYFTEVVKPALQKTICGGIYARVYCIFSACTIIIITRLMTHVKVIHRVKNRKCSGGFDNVVAKKVHVRYLIS